MKPASQQVSAASSFRTVTREKTSGFFCGFRIFLLNLSRGQVLSLLGYLGAPYFQCWLMVFEFGIHSLLFSGTFSCSLLWLCYFFTRLSNRFPSRETAHAKLVTWTSWEVPSWLRIEQYRLASFFLPKNVLTSQHRRIGKQICSSPSKVNSQKITFYDSMHRACTWISVLIG